METKYYVPEIEDFHVGFEYEILLPDGKYHKRICGVTGVKHPGLEEYKDEMMAIAHAITRVKKLDCDAIRELGWEFIKQHGGTDCFDFELRDFSLSVDFDFRGKIWIRIYDGSDIDDEYNYFSGILKNKSDLEKLMKIIEVKENKKPKTKY